MLGISNFLFLSCFSVGFAQNPGTAPVVDEGYPPFWDQINGDIAEYPVKNGKSVINVWNYLDRLKIYKILITETNKYFVQFGKNNTGNVLWALALFYGKLYETGKDILTVSEAVCSFLYRCILNKTNHDIFKLMGLTL